MLMTLTWFPVELHIKVALRTVFHPHRDQTVGDLKYKTKPHKNAKKAGSSSLKKQEAPKLVPTAVQRDENTVREDRS